MKTLGRFWLGVLVCLSFAAAVLGGEKQLDLRRGVPADAYLVAHRTHNSERDFQRKYYNEVWKTVEETRILERAVQIVVSRMSPDQLDKAKAVLQEIREAAAPIPLKALANAKEFLYAQTMLPFSANPQASFPQHLILTRLTPEAAAGTQEGIKNLFELVEKYSMGQVPVTNTTDGEATIVTLAIPAQIPVRPTVIRIGDILLLSSSEQFARTSLNMLLRGEGKSKFDDPRLAHALAQLPKAEDGLTFYDMQQHMSQLRRLADLVRSLGKNEQQVERFAGLLEKLFDEVAILDYEVTVEYTEGNLMRSATYGKLAPGAENKTLFKIFGSGQPFADWQSWVPANATSYSLTTGVNLQPLFEQVISVLRERFPEAQRDLEQFEKMQTRIGVRLDEDILHAFSGECVSVSLPATSASPLGGGESFLAMRCQKPERIRELLHRAIDALKQVPAVAAQQIQLSKCDDLEGFEQVSASALLAMGIKPVIGFHDGWMMIGSNAGAVKAVLATRSGKSPSIADAASFRQFNLEVDGPVYSIRYRNTAEEIRQIAALLNQGGLIGPMLPVILGPNTDPEKLKPVQEVFGLLPSLSKIVAKFDFLQSQLSVTLGGREPGVYHRHTVTVVRPAGE